MSDAINEEAERYLKSYDGFSFGEILLKMQSMPTPSTDISKAVMSSDNGMLKHLFASKGFVRSEDVRVLLQDKNTPPVIRMSLLSSPNAPVGSLLEAINEGSEKEKASVAKNQNLTSEMAHALLSQNNANIDITLAQNPVSPESVLVELWNRGEASVQFGIISEGNAPAELLNNGEIDQFQKNLEKIMETLSNDLSLEDQLRIIGEGDDMQNIILSVNPEIAQESINILLANDEKPFIQMMTLMVRLNSLSEETLGKFIKGDNEDLALIAAFGKNVSKEDAANYFNKRDMNVEMMGDIKSTLGDNDMADVLTREKGSSLKR